jgi:hypothetical protein
MRGWNSLSQASLCGFTDQSHLTQVLAGVVGVSPVPGVGRSMNSEQRGTRSTSNGLPLERVLRHPFVGYPYPILGCSMLPEYRWPLERI